MKHLLPHLGWLLGEQTSAVLPLSLLLLPTSLWVLEEELVKIQELKDLWVKGGFEAFRAGLPKPMVLLVWKCYSEFDSCCCAMECDSDRSSAQFSKWRADALCSGTTGEQAKHACQNVPSLEKLIHLHLVSSWDKTKCLSSGCFFATLFFFYSWIQVAGALLLREVGWFELFIDNWECYKVSVGT